MRHGDVISTCDILASDVQLFVFYLSHALVREISHIGKINGNPDRVCEKRDCPHLIYNYDYKIIKLITFKRVSSTLCKVTNKNSDLFYFYFYFLVGGNTIV